VKTMRQKLMLAGALAIVSVGLFGAAALGTFGPDATSSVASAVAPAASAVMGEDGAGDRLKQLLSGLVKKGVITQAQEDAILAAAKDATAKHVRTAKVIRDLLGESAKYLGVAQKDLGTKLPGTSLGKIADATPNKSRAGLVAALSLAGPVVSGPPTRAVGSARFTASAAKSYSL